MRYRVEEMARAIIRKQCSIRDIPFWSWSEMADDKTSTKYLLMLSRFEANKWLGLNIYLLILN